MKETKKDKENLLATRILFYLYLFLGVFGVVGIFYILK